jgi:hypothetical protein
VMHERGLITVRGAAAVDATNGDGHGPASWASDRAAPRVP